jgi:hypothetical protein
MKARVAWLIATGVLFVGWLSWLAYLAVFSANSVILSRPQFLVSTVDIVADVPEERGRPAGRVTVAEVVWPIEGTAQKLLGQCIEVANLPECRVEPPPRSKDKPFMSGRYILPLVKKENAFYVAGIPPSPGFVDPSLGDERPRIYPANSQTLRQLAMMPKPDPSAK